jgi:hypothetical protein
MNRCDSLSIVSLTVTCLIATFLSLLSLYMGIISFLQWVQGPVTTSLHTNLQMHIWKQLRRLSHDTGWQTTPKKGKTDRKKKKKEDAHNKEITCENHEISVLVIKKARTRFFPWSQRKRIRKEEKKLADKWEKRNKDQAGLKKLPGY